MLPSPVDCGRDASMETRALRHKKPGPRGKIILEVPSPIPPFRKTRENPPHEETSQISTNSNPSRTDKADESCDGDKSTHSHTGSEYEEASENSEQTSEESKNSSAVSNSPSSKDSRSRTASNSSVDPASQTIYEDFDSHGDNANDCLQFQDALIPPPHDKANLNKEKEGPHLRNRPPSSQSSQTLQSVAKNPSNIGKKAVDNKLPPKAGNKATSSSASASNQDRKKAEKTVNNENNTPIHKDPITNEKSLPKNPPLPDHHNKRHSNHQSSTQYQPIQSPSQFSNRTARNIKIPWNFPH